MAIKFNFGVKINENGFRYCVNLSIKERYRCKKKIMNKILGNPNGPTSANLSFQVSFSFSKTVNIKNCQKKPSF